MRNSLKLGYFRLPDSDEENDCAVRACEVAFGMTYRQAHSYLKTQGRVDGDGCNMSWLTNARWGVQPLEGFTLKRAPFERRLRLHRRARHLTEGVWLVLIPEHVFAIRNGVVHDTLCMNELLQELVNDAYRVYFH